jgi:hypothetical protein
MTGVMVRPGEALWRQWTDGANTWATIDPRGGRFHRREEKEKTTKSGFQ